MDLLIENDKNLSLPGSVLNGTYYTFSGPVDAAELVVCVHGIGSFHNCFDRLAKALATDGFRVLQYDLIGRGHSSPSENGKYGPGEHLAQLAKLIKDLALPKFHILGHSMGGALVTLYTIANADRVKSVTLVAPAGLMNSFPLSVVKCCACCLGGALRSALSSRPKQEKAWREDFYSHKGAALELEEQVVQSMHQMYDSNPEAFNAFFCSVMEFPLYGLEREVKQLGECKLPVLLLWGNMDKAVPIGCLQRWQKLLAIEQGCRVEAKQYDKAAHGLLTEIHEQVNNDIGQFLASVAGLVVVVEDR